MTNHVPWPKIHNAHNLRHLILTDPTENLPGRGAPVHYKAKVKLHGSLAAIQIHPDGTLIPQSHHNLISVTQDNYGFANWTHNVFAHAVRHTPMFSKLKDVLTVFGEWAGPGIQQKVAVSKIPYKTFHVFAALYRGVDGDYGFFQEPDELQTFVPDNLQTLKVLPWFDHEVKIDWAAPVETIGAQLEAVNQHVEQIDKVDPYIKDTYGLNGPGEGLVYYPQCLPWSQAQGFFFKAKGETHQVVDAKPAQAKAPIDPQAQNVIDAFVSAVTQPARLQQGADLLGPVNPKNIGPFLAWLDKDIQAECKAEIAATGLDYATALKKGVQAVAKTWYLEKVKGSLNPCMSPSQAQHSIHTGSTTQSWAHNWRGIVDVSCPCCPSRPWTL